LKYIVKNFLYHIVAAYALAPEHLRTSPMKTKTKIVKISIIALLGQSAILCC